MPKYLKIAPDPDARVCHCGDGNPDCDHWESCDGCGMDYRKHEGHDCIDGVPVQDLRALAKELRDSLDACETERDRLCAELDAAHDGEDALRSEGIKLRAQIAALQAEVSQLQSREKACATMDQAERVALVRMGQEIAAILGANDPSPAEIVARVRALQSVPQGVELTDEELDAIYPEGRSLGTYHHEIHRLLLRRVIAAGIKKSLIAGSARLPALAAGGEG